MTLYGTKYAWNHVQLDVGAFIGLWLARQLGLPELLTVNVGGETFPIVWSVLGATVLVAIVALFRRASWA